MHKMTKLPWTQMVAGRPSWAYRGWTVWSVVAGNGWRGRQSVWRARYGNQKRVLEALDRVGIRAKIDAIEDT